MLAEGNVIMILSQNRLLTAKLRHVPPSAVCTTTDSRETTKTLSHRLPPHYAFIWYT